MSKIGPFILLLLAFVFVACSKSDTSTPTNTPQTTQETPTPTPKPSVWKSVREQTQCEAMNPAACVGAYGFKVNADGTYLAGPSPSGRAVSGQISEQELASLSPFVIADIASSSTSACEASTHLPGSADKVRVVESNKSFYDSYSYIGTTGQICYRGDRSVAFELHNQLHFLMMKYYPANFP